MTASWKIKAEEVSQINQLARTMSAIMHKVLKDAENCEDFAVIEIDTLDGELAYLGFPVSILQLELENLGYKVEIHRKKWMRVFWDYAPEPQDLEA